MKKLKTPNIRTSNKVEEIKISQSPIGCIKNQICTSHYVYKLKLEPWIS